MNQSLRIDALDRKLQVLLAFVESHDVALRDFKKEVRDDKRFERMSQLTDQTKNSCDTNMRDIVNLQEAMARQGSVIKGYQEAVEESQRKLKNDIEKG